MKCRDANKKPTMQAMKDVRIEKNEKGRYSAKGQCSTCSGNMFKFMSQADAEAMQKAA